MSYAVSGQFVFNLSQLPTTINANKLMNISNHSKRLVNTFQSYIINFCFMYMVHTEIWTNVYLSKYYVACKVM